MQSERDMYVHETLNRIEGDRHSRGRAPGDEGPRRSLAHAAARSVGRALIAVGRGLLTIGGERRRSEADLAHYTPPPSFFQN
jgi:hypothetical protein